LHLFIKPELREFSSSNLEPLSLKTSLNKQISGKKNSKKKMKSFKISCNFSNNNLIMKKFKKSKLWPIIELKSKLKIKKLK
jgi:hypothetical protein